MENSGLRVKRMKQIRPAAVGSHPGARPHKAGLYAVGEEQNNRRYFISPSLTQP